MDDFIKGFKITDFKNLPYNKRIQKVLQDLKDTIKAYFY